MGLGKTEMLIPICMPDIQIQVCGQNEPCYPTLTTVVNDADWVTSTIVNTFLTVLEAGSSKLKCQHDEFLPALQTIWHFTKSLHDRERREEGRREERM